MLSDEEKKAIENIKDFKNLKWYEHAFDNGTEVLDEEQKQDIDVVLNLIEKQSKEIKELKQENLIQRSQLNSVWDRGFIHKDKIKEEIEEKFLEAKGLYERGVQPQAQYTMKILRDLESSLLEKE